jgi:phosphohistidine phosphatase
VDDDPHTQRSRDFVTIRSVTRLYLLRHAKSSWADPALQDHERPLAPRGLRATKRLARHLRRVGVRPELVLCSSAQRTRQTLDGLSGALGEPQVAIEDDLYAAGAGELLNRLQRVPAGVESVLLIGHNPGLETLGLWLAADGARRKRLEEKFPTGALATLAFEAPWSELGPGTAELVDFVVPRELD